MKFSLILLICLASIINAIDVSNSDDLQKALDKAKPGDVINLKDGTYKGQFKATNTGTASKKITLKGSERAVLTGGKVDSDGYCLHLENVDYYVLDGFSVKKCLKGIMLDGSNNNVLQNLTVSDIGTEGVHFRKHSSDNVIQTSKISNCGLVKADFGEGVYIGSARSNWGSYTNGKEDRSNRNKVLRNKFGPGITAEAIDIKEGTENGLIEDNDFDGDGLADKNSGNSWMDVKGSGYTIKDNRGKNSLSDGFQINHVKETNDLSGCGNVFINNSCKNIGTKTKGVCVNQQHDFKCKKPNDLKRN